MLPRETARKSHKLLSFVTRAPNAGANTSLQLLLENYKSKKGHKYVKKNLRVTCLTGVGFPFNSKHLVCVSSKHLQ